MSRKYSRYEINQIVKTVLVRHAVDLSVIDFSCTEHSVYFKGELKKDPRGDLTRQQLMAMVRELESLPLRLDYIFDLENWTVTQRYGSWELAPRKKVGVVLTEEKPFTIRETDVLEDIMREFTKD